MAGEINLDKLLANMEPVLNPGTYVFATLANVDEVPRSMTIGEFQEKEGLSVILEKGKADQLGLEYEYEAAWITCRVHSALEAVGLTAKIANALATNGLSCNVVAGNFHDHLFVPKAEEKKAMDVLLAIVSDQNRNLG